MLLAAVVEVALDEDRVALAVQLAHADELRIAVALQQRAEDLELRLRADDLSHVGQLLGHLLQHVDVAVLTGDVLQELLCRAVGVHVPVGPSPVVLRNGQSVDVGAVHILTGSVRQLLDILLHEVIADHEVGREVHHRRSIVVLVEQDTAASANRLPVVHLIHVALEVHLGAGRVQQWHFLRQYHGHGVRDVHAAGASHIHAFARRIARLVAQQLDEVCVVDHRTLQQVLLLGLREVIHRLHAAGTQITLPRRIVGHEQGDTARAAQHLRIVRLRQVWIIDEGQRGLEVTPALQLFINAATQPRRSAREQVVLTRRQAHRSTDEHHSSKHSTHVFCESSFEKTVFHLLLICYLLDFLLV